jgi:hypothetical protein
MFTGVKWLGYCTFLLFISYFLINLITIFTDSSEILEVGDDKLIIKKKFGRDYAIYYNQIKHCVVCPSMRGTNIEIDIRDNKSNVSKFAFYFWVNTDRLNAHINKLSEKCDVYVWRWSRFWKGEQKWKPVKVSSTWVPFDERDKKNTNV